MKKIPVVLLAVTALLVVLGFLAVDKNIGGVFRPPTPTATGTPTQPAVPSLPAANVTCNELSFYLDPALGSGYECQTVPESSSSDIPMDVFIYPLHTELTIQNYPLTQTQFPPQIWVYPVSRFEELLPDTLPRRVADLRLLISGGAWSGGELPFLPPIPQLQSFFAHQSGIAFYGGGGIRFITEYTESVNAITNATILYTFQGLTHDGAYWVAVTLPISSPILSEDSPDMLLPEGYTWESLAQNYSTYASEVKEALEAQRPSSFFPAIALMDSLVESITITP